MSTKNDALSAIVEKAKKDPAFFHALVFDPESALKSMGDADRKTKASIIGNNPEDILQVIAGGLSWCDVTCASSCGATCTGSSCGYTTNIVENNRFVSRLRNKLSYCDVTCTSSCGVTCNASCGYTTNIVDQERFQDYR